MRESLWLAAKVHGTRFAYSHEQIEILRNYYLQGTRRMIRGRFIDYNACGRRVGRPAGFKIPALELVHQMEQYNQLFLL